jgi:hypothetical protein
MEIDFWDIYFREEWYFMENGIVIAGHGEMGKQMAKQLKQERDSFLYLERMDEQQIREYAAQGYVVVFMGTGLFGNIEKLAQGEGRTNLTCMEKRPSLQMKAIEAMADMVEEGEQSGKNSDLKRIADRIHQVITVIDAEDADAGQIVDDMRKILKHFPEEALALVQEAIVSFDGDITPESAQRAAELLQVQLVKNVNVTVSCHVDTSAKEKYHRTIILFS